MRSRPPCIVTLAVLALAAACGHAWSIHPLFTDKELVFEPALLGAWREESATDADRWVLLRASDTSSSYILVLADSIVAAALVQTDLEALFAEDSAARKTLARDPAARARRERDSTLVAGLRSDARGPRWFDVRLGRLAASLFADIAPMTAFDSEPRLGRSLQVPAHWFWRVSLDGDRLRVVPLGEEWLGKKLDSGKVRLAHEKENDDVVLTAPTRDLQRLVAQVANDTLAFARKAERTLRRQR